VKPTPAELAEKETRLRALMKAEGLDAVLIGRQDDFSWFTGGASGFVGIASEASVASLLITGDHKWLLCDNIEQPRMLDEELGSQGYVPESWHWTASGLRESIARLVPNGRLGSDIPLEAAQPMREKIARLRWPLVPAEVERYRWLGEQASGALAEVCKEVRPGMTEWQVAARLGYALLEREIVPTLLLVAADERAYLYRHPIPTAKAIEKHAMLVIGARKWGLILSATRMVHFGKPDADLARKHAAAVEVDAAFISSTVPGALVSDIFKAGQQAYARAGFPDEWRHHHQGGPTGYAPREFRATAQSNEAVLENQAFAWNPSIAGTKSEDTMIATAQGPEILSLGGDFPTVKVEAAGKTWPRPDILTM
jgi:Xaa-Pro aminopeptidase